MFYSKKLNILFIACPKTGSTSVEEFLMSLDADGERFKVHKDGKVYTSSDVKSPSLGHAKAAELRALLGTNDFCRLTTFGLVRDPREKLVSTYFFMKKGSIRKSMFHTKGANRAAVAARTIAGILFARILPFSVWARLWPMKRCSDYLLDGEGQILVNFLGRTERLNHDLIAILSRIGLSQLAQEAIPHVNRSRHRDPLEYFSSDSLMKFIERKYSQDLYLCELTQSGIYSRPTG